MEARRSWWQQIKKHPYATGVVLFLVLILFVFLAYRFGWDWTGFDRPSKTLWDWLQLLGVLAVPVVVGFGAVWFTTRQGKVADAENKDSQREAALQAYIDKMSELLLEKNLRESVEKDEVRKVARVRTLTILSRLDAKRKYHVLQFLYESDLINKPGLVNKSGFIDEDQPIIDLNGADLSGASLSLASLMAVRLSGANLNDADLSRALLSDADLLSVNLSHAHLMRADLSGAFISDGRLIGAHLFAATMWGTDLSHAYLMGADLSKASLIDADLSDADLSGANLTGANLTGANLSGAIVTSEELAKAKSLKGATLPDGSIHQ
jgi:uncharacterized protein YjbI with pentapeptide repeats